MRLLLPLLLGLLAGCGSSTDSKKVTEIKSGNNAGAETAAPTDNTLTEAEKADGWMLLFDGKTTTGWHTYLNKAGRWKIEDGILNADSTRGPALMGSSGIMASSMVTDKDYENFDLKVDWKISTGGNSGIMILVKENPDVEEDFRIGPEMQILDNVGWKGFNGKPTTDVQKDGALYGLLPCSDSTAIKPAGEWNTSEIIKKDSALEFKLNGSTVVKTTLWNDNWKKLVAGSRYKDAPFYGIYKTGKITLQDHSYKVWFKNIKLKQL